MLDVLPPRKAAPTHEYARPPARSVGGPAARTQPLLHRHGRARWRPQLTQTWIDTDGDHLLLNTVEGHRKLANMGRDPRVVVNVCDRDALSRYWVLRGHVVDTTTEGAAEHIEALSQRYTGGPYRNYGGRSGGRVLVRIAVDRIVQRPW